MDNIDNTNISSIIQNYIKDILRVIGSIFNYKLKNTLKSELHLIYLKNSNNATLKQKLDEDMNDFYRFLKKGISALVSNNIRKNGEEVEFNDLSYQVVIKPLDPINFISNFTLYQNNQILKTNYISYLKTNLNMLDINENNIDNIIKQQSNINSANICLIPPIFSFNEYFKLRNSKYLVYIDAFKPLQEFWIKN